jgi:hypothetical protein
MQPAKFTPDELATLVSEAVAWLHQQREKYRPCSLPLTATLREELQPFFMAETLDSLRIVDASLTRETIPYPPFYERVRAGGSRGGSDAAHMTAIPFIDVAVFSRKPTLRTLFHTLVHVTQFSILGVERVMEGYLGVLNEAGLWMVVPFEEQAYQLDGRYTKNPAEVFSGGGSARMGTQRQILR